MRNKVRAIGKESAAITAWIASIIPAYISPVLHYISLDSCGKTQVIYCFYPKGFSQEEEEEGHMEQ